MAAAASNAVRSSINPLMAKRIASIYVDTYATAGFQLAQEYLLRVTRGNLAIQQELMPLIIEESNRRK